MDGTMHKSNDSILFLGKKQSDDCRQALEFCQQQFSNVAFALGEWREPFPESFRSWRGDYIISYLSRWVVPASLIERASKAAINFHPASPEYPGIGCTNFALYEGAAEYGATCHHMAARVDTGAIIAVKRFPILASDTVASLLEKTYAKQLELFYEVTGHILKNEPLPSSRETWTRPPFSRAEFNQLSQIAPNMSPEEIAARIRATSYGPWQPTVTLGGHTFQYVPPAA
jgi:methionyl-tRNA formyltransferase